MSNDTLIFRFPIQPNSNRNPPFFILNFLSQNVPESLIKANPYPVINIPPTPLFLSPLSRLGPSPPDTHPAIIISSSTSNLPTKPTAPFSPFLFHEDGCWYRRSRFLVALWVSDRRRFPHGQREFRRPWTTLRLLLPFWVSLPFRNSPSSSSSGLKFSFLIFCTCSSLFLSTVGKALFKLSCFSAEILYDVDFTSVNSAQLRRVKQRKSKRRPIASYHAYSRRRWGSHMPRRRWSRKVQAEPRLCFELLLSTADKSNPI